jgi:hypothetical protein
VKVRRFCNWTGKCAHPLSTSARAPPSGVVGPGGCSSPPVRANRPRGSRKEGRKEGRREGRKDVNRFHRKFESARTRRPLAHLRFSSFHFYFIGFRAPPGSAPPLPQSRPDSRFKNCEAALARKKISPDLRAYFSTFNSEELES